jgi:RimJ/RimL family protein N-acetyltransferase
MIDFELGERLPTIEAGSVRLRWLTQADAPALFAIFCDPEVTRYFGLATFEDLDAARELIAEIHEDFRERELFEWGIEADGRLVGTCTLAHLDEDHRRAELGFALARTEQGKGYMRAALPALLDFAFERLGLHRVYADTDPRNERSIRALERLGFRREGLLREHYLVHGEAQDGVLYGLLRSEWTSRSDMKGS